MTDHVLALDQGTTSSRAIVFDREGRICASAQQELPQILPGPGLVEHDPEAIWRTQRDTAREALARAGLDARRLAAVGVTNQRETTILWERDTGRPVAPAIVWQSRVSADICQRLRDDGVEPLVQERTGLVLDPYFSGSKIRWLLDSVSGLRERAARGDVLFGTVDSFLLWRLTGGRLHATDTSNASRTLLFNLQTLDWDDELLRIFGVPRAMLPEVRPSSGLFGRLDPDLLGDSTPIAGVAGDQQAAAFGQACFAPGDAKNTYGTGAFLLMNTGSQPVRSTRRLLATVGWTIGDRTTYCLEGSVFVAGALVQWLRDGLGLIERSEELEELAASVPDAGGVTIVPAFTGLGAPHWDPWARGAILGLTRGVGAGHLARAALEAIALQVDELLTAMQLDSGRTLRELKVDGGAAANRLLLQTQADVTGVVVRRPVVAETTALGAACLAGLAVGFWNDLDDLARRWRLDAEFHPASTPELRARRRHVWQEAVRRASGWAQV